MTDVIEGLRAARLVPVVVLDDGARGADLAHALLAGGVTCAEITLRTPAGLAAIASAAEVPGFLVGAGTVLTVEQLEAVANAGARFAVSPGWSDELVERAASLGITMLPGVATATEVQRAAVAGVRSLKFFPAESMGGVATLDAFRGPFPDVSFMPSGGVSAENAADYLSRPNVLAVSGSWIATRSAIAAGDWESIAALARAASS